jgi:hypothetical protein
MNLNKTVVTDYLVHIRFYSPSFLSLSFLFRFVYCLILLLGTSDPEQSAIAFDRTVITRHNTIVQTFSNTTLTLTQSVK